MSVFILYFITLFTCSIYGSYRPEIKYIYLFIIYKHFLSLQKNFTKILGINGQKKVYNRNYLHNTRTFPFQNIVHSVLLYETFRMMGHSISSNIVKFVKIRFE